MSTREARIIDQHEYDGIQEYDNPTPGWWSLLFFITFVFSVVYFMFFHMSPESKPLRIDEQYKSAVADDLRAQFGEIGDLEADEATILKYMKEPKWLTVGQTAFTQHCVSCHGGNAQGLTGPNMTDDHYKNVKKLEDIATVIANGAANGAMPVWKHRLHKNEVVLLAAYIANLRGTTVAGGKAPEGDPIAPWPTAAAAKDGPATSAPASQPS